MTAATMPSWPDWTEQVRNVEAEALARCLEIAELEYETMMAVKSQDCESPIEAMFLAAFLRFQFEHLLSTDHGLIIWPQVKVLDYRADFVVGMWCHNHKPGHVQRIVVECDGHDYHERTKEQAARDKKRDREMQAAGYDVWRFTGSELHNDAMHCAEDVYLHLLKMASSCDRSPEAAAQEPG